MAMASGVPVVSTRHSGIPELVEHGVSGRLAAERDAGDLAAQLRLLCESPRARTAHAEAARARLETTLPHVFEDSSHSPAVVLALVMEHAEPVASSQRSSLATHLPDLAEPVAKEAERVSSLDRRDRLILLELMSVRLPEALVDSQGRLAFIEALQALVEADNHVSTFEIACLQMVGRRLFPITEEAHTTNAKAILHAASILSTRLARETKADDAAIAAILQQTSRQAPYFINQLTPAESLDPADIEGAFARLAEAPLGIRRQFLEVCERIVAADEQATLAEVELLRAMAMSLRIPAAPIFPKSAAQAPLL